MNTNNITPRSFGATSAKHTALAEIKKHSFAVFALLALGVATLTFAGCSKSPESAMREAIIKYHNATGQYPNHVDYFENRYIPTDGFRTRFLTPEEQAIDKRFMQKFQSVSSLPAEEREKFLTEFNKLRDIFDRVSAEVQASNGK